MSKVEIDPNTGLPKLPPKFFWRVKRVGGAAYSNRVYVVIRRKLLFFSFEVHSVMAGGNIYDKMETAVRNRAIDAYEEFFKTTEREQEIQKLLGNYPPKKLS